MLDSFNMSNDQFIESLGKRQHAMLDEYNRLQHRVGVLRRQIDAAQVLLEGEQKQDDAEAKPESFAAIVRSTLKKLGGVKRPKEVATAMIQDNPALSNENGKLVTNVNTELYRMWKSKKIPVNRVSEGRYKWVT